MLADGEVAEADGHGGRLDDGIVGIDFDAAEHAVEDALFVGGGDAEGFEQGADAGAEGDFQEFGIVAHGEDFEGAFEEGFRYAVFGEAAEGPEGDGVKDEDAGAGGEVGDGEADAEEGGVEEGRVGLGVLVEEAAGLDAGFFQGAAEGFGEAPVGAVEGGEVAAGGD